MADKIFNDVRLSVKWKTDASEVRPDIEGEKDAQGYCNENLATTLGKVARYLKDYDAFESHGHALTDDNITGTLPISKGGTGATSASAARTALGLGTAATANTESTVANDSKLPTGSAVKTFVEGKGYVTSSGVTNVASGDGLTGGPITSTGTLKANLKDYTKSTVGVLALTNPTANTKFYPVSLDKDGKLGVSVPWTYTDTKVTSAANHYAPSEDSGSALSKSASSSTAATWGTTALVTGVTIARDAKGHVTGLSLNSIKMPSNPNTNTTYTFAEGTTNGAFSVTPSGGSEKSVTIHGLGSAAYKAVGSVESGNPGLVTGGDVWTAIDNLPEPMVFKGSLGTGGTITALPVDGTATVGDTYKVITAGTYDSKSAKVGDTFICDSKTSSANTWTLIPSGDEPSGTVTSVGSGDGLTGGAITSSGTLKANLKDYTKPTVAALALTNPTANTKFYPVSLDKDGKLAVSVPWTDNNTDTKVTQNVSSDTSGKKYGLLFSYYETSSSTTTAQASSRKNSIYAIPKDDKIVAGAYGITSGSYLNSFASASLSANATQTFPATGGTVLNTGTTSYTANTASTDTNAYKIGTIKINGTSTDIYGKFTNTTYSVFSGATASADGAQGLVKKPVAGDQAKYLRGDGTWATPTNTDTKVNVTLATTAKAYLLGTSTTPTSTAAAVTALADTGVYLDTTAGKLTATTFAGQLDGTISSNTHATTKVTGDSSPCIATTKFVHMDALCTNDTLTINCV